MNTLRDPTLSSLLKATSRSFHLTLQAMPAAVRVQIGLAYLLARTTDTIADTELVPLERRLQALADLGARIQGTEKTKVEFGELAGKQKDAAERLLLEHVSDSIALLGTLEPQDVILIRQVLSTITSGQELDLRRFAGASAERIVALKAPEELDDYTYRVAGCVGEFWTRICRAHLFKAAKLDDETLQKQGVRFGKGLQLVNILRDLAADLRQGRCYLPESELRAHGLDPAELLLPENMTRLLPIYEVYVAQAQRHLQAGWEYTNALPRSAVRVRLACAWPLWLGFRTLELLRSANVLDPRERTKVSRKELKKMVLRSVISYPFPGAWRRLMPAVKC